jgi:hypothetical protein
LKHEVEQQSQLDQSSACHTKSLRVIISRSMAQPFPPLIRDVFDRLPPRLPGSPGRCSHGTFLASSDLQFAPPSPLLALSRLVNTCHSPPTPPSTFSISSSPVSCSVSDRRPPNAMGGGTRRRVRSIYGASAVSNWQLKGAQRKWSEVTSDSEVERSRLGPPNGLEK